MTLFERRLGSQLVAGALFAGCVAGCSTDPDLGGETHWLDECTTDADCSGEASCLCGVCTIGCEGDNDCGGGPLPAQCYEVSSPGLSGHCAGSEVPEGAVCLATCETNADCPGSGTCLGEACLPDGSNGGGGGDGGSLDPAAGNIFVDEISRGIGAERVDLLFVIDNSLSMADKQEVFARTVPRLIDRLVNPDCVDASGARSRVTSAETACPDGSAREFPAVEDLHVGVVSSSLGTVDGACEGSSLEQKNDRGHLIGSRPRAASLGLAEPFLSWSPSSGSSDASELTNAFGSLVETVGELGCGYEAPLEAMYRFLADPVPPAEIQTAPCTVGSSSPCAQPVGIDSTVLEQRAAFLRPDSLLGVVVLSDENDCSIQQTGQLYYVARSIDLPKASSTCAANPNDACCYSCALNPPDGCTPDPTCQDASGRTAVVPEAADNINLRCFNQVQRFGISFLHDPGRYVRALSAFQLCNSRADLSVEECPADNVYTNPIFSDLSGSGGATRTPSDVFFMPIVGVPWQDIAVNPSGSTLRFRQSSEIPWDVILGDPPASPPIPPDDPLMRESVIPRPGTNPITGDALAAPGAGYMANPINGHEWTIATNDDLQYACIFPLVQPKDCSSVSTEQGCDCRQDVDLAQNPLCQAPDGGYGTVQYAAKAYPGIRHLQVARGLGNQAVVGSICPRQLTAPAAQDFGYGPSLDAFVDRASSALAAQCLPRELVVTEGPEGPTTNCGIIEAIPSGSGSCTGPGRRDASEATASAVYRRLETNGICNDCAGVFTVCELLPSTSDDNRDGTADCLEDGGAPSEPGWCYVDPSQGLGDEGLVADCPSDQQRRLRFVGDDLPRSGARLFVTCSGAALSEE